MTSPACQVRRLVLLLSERPHEISALFTIRVVRTFSLPRELTSSAVCCCLLWGSVGHERAIRELLEQGRARLVATTLGADGCMIVTR